MQDGLTLIEIIIALSIVAAIAFFTLPTMQHFIAQSQADVKQAELLHALQFAETSARYYRAPVVICKTIDGEHCGGEWRDGQLVFLDLNRNGIPNQQAILSITKAIAGELHWRNFPGNNDALRFMAEGNTTNNGTFWYCYHSVTNPFWAITISQSGRLRVILPDRRGQVKDSEGNVLSC